MNNLAYNYAAYICQTNQVNQINHPLLYFPQNGKYGEEDQLGIRSQRPLHYHQGLVYGYSTQKEALRCVKRNKDFPCPARGRCFELNIIEDGFNYIDNIILLRTRHSF